MNIFSHVYTQASAGTDSPPQNLVLAAQINNLQKTNNSSTSKHKDSASQVYQAALAKSKLEDGGQGTPTSVARQLFPSADGEQSGEGSATSTLERSRRRKTVDTPVKTLGIASENASPTSSSVPEWVAMAKVNLEIQKRGLVSIILFHVTTLLGEIHHQYTQ